jgi:hypothetical protein
MPQVGFQLMIPMSDGANTAHALDCAATVIGQAVRCCLKFNNNINILSLKYM